MRCKFDMTRCLDLHRGSFSSVCVIEAFGNKFTAGLVRLVLRDEQNLLGLVAHELRKLFYRTVLHNVRKAVVHANRFAALRSTINAQVAQICRHRNLVPVHMIFIDLPRTFINDTNAPFAYRITVLFLA